MYSLASEYPRQGIKETENLGRNEKLGRILLCLYIIIFAFWAFDVGTTFYAINVLGVAGEENPLGWPFGVWGALIFYVPTLVFVYLLLSRAKDKCSPWVAVFITALAMLSGILNLLAGLHNLNVISNFI
jgi:hypothetical protein